MSSDETIKAAAQELEVEVNDMVNRRDHRFADPDAVIGHLIPHPTGPGYGVLCLTCVAGSFDGFGRQINVNQIGDVGSMVFGVNVNPYKVVCCKCGTVVTPGCGTELFDGR